MSKLRKDRWTYGLVSYACNVIATFSLFFFVLSLLPSFDPVRGTAMIPGGGTPRMPGLDVEVNNIWNFHLTGDLPWWLDVLGRLDQAVPLLCWGIGAYVLGEVVRSIQAGQPFDQRNPRRISTLAILVAFGGTGLGLLHYLVSSLLLARVDVPRRLWVSAELDVRPISLVIAGVLFVVAVAFKQGRRLTQDVEGLV